MRRPVLAIPILFVCLAGALRAQCPDGTPPPCGPHQTPPSPNSIAVLPFVSRSPDTADVYLAEGMTDEVGNHLTQLSRLQVKARGVVAAAWQRNPDPLGAARALRVAWYVHGTVRHVAPQLLVSVELVRPATGEQVWAKRFAQPDADVFASQAEVAESVAVMVGGRLSPGERGVLTRRPTRSNEAYRLYLYGRALVTRRTRADIELAVNAFSQAIGLDSRFAAAWARLAFSRALQVNYGTSGGLSRDSLLSLGRTAAERALALDSTSAEAWLARGTVAALEPFRRGRHATGGDLRTAYDALERALRMDSLNADCFHLLGWLYSADLLELPEVAEPFFGHALQLDPDLRISWDLLGWSYLAAGRAAEAEAAFDSALARGAWNLGHRDRAWARFARGDGAGALADLAEATRLGGAKSNALDPDSASFAVALGDSVPARARLTAVLAAADSGVPAYGDVATLSAALGLRDAALAALEHLKARSEARSETKCGATACSASLATWRLLHSPVFAPLRGDPRFQRLWAETRPRVPWLAGQGR